MTHPLELAMAVTPEVMCELIYNFQNKIVSKKSDNDNFNVRLYNFELKNFLFSLLCETLSTKVILEGCVS